MSDLSTSSNNIPRRRSGMWLIFIGIMVIAAVLGGVFFMQRNSAPAASIADTPLNFADVIITDLRQEEEFNGKLESIKGTGTVIPAVQMDLAFNVPGAVTEIFVMVGEDVQSGDVLAHLETTDLEQAVTQAEINQRLAQISLEEALEPATEAVVQAAQDAVDQAAAVLQLAQINQEGAANSTLLTQSLPDAQDNYIARLSDYNGWLDNYNNDKTTYWYVDQAQQALEAAEQALTSIEFAIEQMMQSADNSVALAVDQYNQAKNALDVLLDGASPSAIESLELQVQAAELSLTAARNALSNAVLIAPFDGVVTSITMAVGQNVGGGAPVISLADLTQPTLEIFLSETNLDKIEVGTEVEARFSAFPAGQFRGSIVQIDPQLTTSNNYLSLLRVLVQLENEQERILPSGLSASVHVIGTSNRIVRVFLPLNDEGMLTVGDPVTVELPDFTLVPGIVVFVPQTPTASASGQATFHVLVELVGPGDVDEATAVTMTILPDETSVDVIFVSDAVDDVMAIPVSALLALLEGGYAVEKKVGIDQTQLVAVEAGFFDSNNMIAITSDTLQPGDQVVVP